MFRWSSLKGFAALILFIVSALLIEYLIIVYAVSIGVRDEYCFQIPWLGLTVSPLFHLVPTSTVVVLAASWACMTRYIAAKPIEKTKPAQKKPKTPSEGLRAKISGFLSGLKSRLLRIKGFAYVWGKFSFARATVKSAITVLLGFMASALLVSVIANPWLIHNGFVSLYRGNPQLLDSIKAFNSALGSFAEVVSPIGWICSAVNNAFRAAAPGIRDFASSLGALTKPLVDLSPMGKYLVFQNIAAWTSALTVLAYGAYTRKSYRYRRVKRS